jgi:hypothetical protein
VTCKIFLALKKITLKELTILLQNKDREATPYLNYNKGEKMTIEFEKGYLFGKVLGQEKYILMDCQPNDNDPYGIINYSYGNADFLRLTKEQLKKLNLTDFQ